MRMNRPNLLMAATILGVLIVGQSRGQETAPSVPQPLTLDAAIQIALANHRQIVSAESQLDSARAQLTQSKSGYFPKITPSYSYTSSGSSRSSNPSHHTEQSSGASLEQTIFDSGKREIGLAQSRDAVRGASFGVLDTRASVILNATTSYYELLRTKELVRVAESGLERARTTLEATKAFVEAGTSAKKDILQAQADYSNADVGVIQARNNVRLAETSLRTALGIMAPVSIVTPSEAVAAPSATPDPKAIPEYVAQALSGRPDLRQSEASLGVTRKNVQLARIEAGPQVQSTVSGTYSAHPTPGLDREVGVSVTYPLFDAGSSKARVREAKAGLRSAEAQIELARQEIAADVESAYLSREEARTRITATQSALGAARANYDSATESHKEGVGTILDVITAENALVTAETNAVQAIFDFYTSDARLRRAVGNNDPYASGGKL